jgi:hypothetical protein
VPSSSITKRVGQGVDLDWSVGNGVDGGVEASTAECREISHSIPNEALDCDREITLGQATVEHGDLVTSRNCSVGDCSPDEGRSASDQEFHGSSSTSREA